MAQAQENERRGGYRAPYEPEYVGGRRVEDWSRYWGEEKTRPSVVERARRSPWGKALTAYYGEMEATGRIVALATAGEPLYSDMWRIYQSPRYKATIARKFPWTTTMGGVRGASAADWKSFGLGLVETMREELAAGGRQTAEELRAKEPWLKKWGIDMLGSPLMYSRFVPVRYAVEKIVPIVGAVARPIVGAIGRRPTAARWLLTPGKRIAQLGDEELTSLWYGLRGRLGLSGRVWRASAKEVKGALRGLDSKQVEEVGRLLQETRDLASYSAAVRAGRMEPASSNAVIEGFVRSRRLLDEAFKRIPHRAALPGSAEEAAAIVRVRAAGGAARAGKRPLKAGEYRVPEELQEVRKGEKLIRRRDRVTGVEVTAYRRGYYQLPARVRPGAAPPKRGVAKEPRARRPREAQQPVIARTAEEVRGDLRRMIAREPGYAVLRGMQDDLARAFARSAALGDPVQRKAALEVFKDLEKRLGEKAVRNALAMLDHLAVTKVKQVYTLYNPAWYFKNFIDSQWLKNLLAGVAPGKLRNFWREAPKDVYGNSVEVGVTWTKELTGFDMKAAGALARGGNWVENVARAVVWDDVYWKAMKTLRATGKSVETAHRRAGNAAMQAVAKVHFDYGDLSKTDEVMRRIVPFWVYQRNQLRWMGQQVVERPRIAYGGLKFFQLGERGGGPAVRPLPGLPTLQVQAFAIVSPERYMRTICDVMSGDEGQQKRWREAGLLDKLFIAGERGGFYAHPLLEQGLSALLKSTDLMDAKSWKDMWPLVRAVGKTFGVEATWLGVWRTMFPEDRYQPRMGQLQQGLKRRVMMRRAFSVLDGKEQSAAQCEKYVRREMMWAGLGAVFGMFPKVREPKYEEMQRLLKERGGLSYAARQDFDEGHPEVGWYLSALAMKAK